MGRRIPKTGIRIGNSITWNTIYHSSLKNTKRAWYFEEKLMKKIIEGVCRKAKYYTSEIVIHVFPSNQQSKPKVHIKYLIWREENFTNSDVHFLTSKIVKKLLTLIFPKYSFFFDVQALDRSMLSKNVKLFGEYLTDKLMAEPHRDKQILGYEFRKASRSILKKQ